MLLDGETLRFIFGFKLRGLRQERDLSLKRLAGMTGLSPSYINEIEKGKKYPKSEKILLLAGALGVSYDELTSVKLGKELGIIAQVLGNTVIRGLPFDIFGIPSSTLFELMAERPQNFSMLVGTLLELARNHNIKVEDIFHATLRAYLDAHNNHFPDLEKQAVEFRRKLRLERTGITTSLLLEHLRENEKVQVEEVDFNRMDPELSKLHFLFRPGKSPKLLLNHQLSEKERLFILAREAGYASLRIKERPSSNLHSQLDSFDSLLGSFRAAYFAGAVLIPREQFVRECETFFARPQWDPRAFSEWVDSHPAPPSAFFHRWSQILPAHFDLDQIFLLRFDYTPSTRRYQLLRELHLSELHAPHDTKNRGHYCRRWITTTLLKELADSDATALAGAQRSRFVGGEKEYLCFSLAYRQELNPTRTECLTVGIRIDASSSKVIRMLGDRKIPAREVSDTCENCAILDCQERAAPPLLVEDREVQDRLGRALERLERSQ